MIRLQKILWLLWFAILAGCASPGTETENPMPQPVKDSIDLLRSSRAPEADQMLDVAIVSFDVQAADRESAYVGDWIFQDILEIESLYLPTLLRETLIESNQWGVVRVLPQQDLSMDVTVRSTILSSDGVQLMLRVDAVDSTGRPWLSKDYAYPYKLQETQDPFQSLYNEIANDLLAVRRSLSDSEIKNINRVTDLRHAADLSPDTFADLLETDPNGLTRVTRLLADNDPMLARIERMRVRHNLFIDTLDNYYQELNLSMQPVYDLWRYYSREQILEVENEIRKDANKNRNNSGFTAISNNYFRYKAKKLFEQEWRELAEGFTQELEPQILQLNNQVYSLKGSVEDQYVQWRRILRQFYLQERGL